MSIKIASSRDWDVNRLNGRRTAAVRFSPGDVDERTRKLHVGYFLRSLVKFYEDVDGVTDRERRMILNALGEVPSIGRG